MKRIYIVDGQAYYDWVVAVRIAKDGEEITAVDAFEPNEFPDVNAAKTALGAEEFDISTVEITSTVTTAGKVKTKKRNKVVVTFKRKVGDFDAMVKGEILGKGNSSYVKLDASKLKIGG